MMPHPAPLPFELRYRAELPIFAHKDEIVAAIRAHQVIIVTGETGCGKTTQLPLMCLEALGGNARIMVTQPRRIAAVSLGRRIAQDLSSAPGEIVGFRTRFDECVRPSARILLQTDGIPVSEIGRDRYFRRYDAIIIDEAHERNLNIDILIGHLRWLVGKRRDLRIIVSSATINPELFAQAFAPAPIIHVAGRNFPIEIIHDAFDEKSMTAVEAVVRAVERIDDTGDTGDILVFLPTEREIVAAKRMIDGRKLKAASTTLPLFARLSRAHQERIFREMPARKIVLATNIAETSITVPGIRFVIDTGLARIKRYQPTSRITALPVERISRASADQRAGRCGRTQNGVCIRLYSKEDYASRDQFTSCEIARSNMAGVLLTMIAHRLGTIERFAFLEKPSPRSVHDGYSHLQELGAIDDAHRLTRIGDAMARLPLDPHLSRMVVAGKESGSLDEMCIIAAALSCADPRERPADKTEMADAAHRAFADPISDFVWYLNFWRRYHDEQQKNRSQARMRTFCADNFVSFVRMMEWRDLYAQIACEVRPSAGSGNFASIHTAVLCGLIGNIALRNEEKKNYRMSHGGEGVIFPGSACVKKAHQWVMFAEKVETSRLFLRTVAQIDPAWIPKVAPHLVKQRYSEPFFEEESGIVRATEYQTVFGLTIGSKGVAYGRIDPDAANDVFIREGLIEGMLRTHYRFLQNNRSLPGQVAMLEAKLRVHNLYAGDEQLFEFYKERIAGVSSIHDLNKEVHAHGGDAFLRCPIDECMTREIPHESAQWPDSIAAGTEHFPLTYRYDPADPMDGITLHLPAGAREYVSDAAVSWLIRPLWERRIEALIDSLPRETRKKLSPARETAVELAAVLRPGPEHFLDALSECIKIMRDIDIPASRLMEIDIAAHLWVHALFDDERPEARRAVESWRSAFESWGKRNARTWSFGDLPLHVAIIASPDCTLFGYPALRDNGETVDLIACASREQARTLHPKGISRLITFELGEELGWVGVQFKLDKIDRPWVASLGDPSRIVEHAVRLILDRFGSPPDPDCRTQAAFAAHVADAKKSLPGSSRALLGTLVEAGKLCASIAGNCAEWKKKRPGALYAKAIHEIGNALSEYRSLVLSEQASYDFLLNLPRYLRALDIALSRAMADPNRFFQKNAVVVPFAEMMRNAAKPPVSRIRECRIALEEFKISLFAQQEVKAAPGTSEKKLRETFAGLDLSFFPA
jgi:ATP-dependent helicase HrpA